jgi:glc operon protein GlcG
MRTITHRCLAAAAVLCSPLLPAPSAAQVLSIATLSHQAALRVAAAAGAEAKRLKAPGGAIAVVDAGGHLLVLERLDGTFAAAADISAGKARTAARFQRPTKTFEEIIRKGRTPMLALDDFTPLLGGVPIVVAGAVVGAIGVSGAASADQDEEIALAGARALEPSADMGPPVSYFGAKEVAAAFAKGAVLLGEEAGRSYMVHASRREAPGMAEVHALDTDIIYVLQGTATFVTGGTLVEGRTTAPNEIRGRAIEGGDTRTLGPGDVVVVPDGTPHWFQAVAAPFTYYVVKVRG